MADTRRKTEFWWASIGGAQPEPVEKCTVDGRPAVYTLGCGDPFFLDEPNCPVKLGMADFATGDSSRKIINFNKLDPMERPTLAAADEKQTLKEYYVPAQKKHSWRGPR